MSVEAITWALNLAPVPVDTNGKPNTACAFVLIGLANHADPDGTATFPSARTLARYTRMSVRHVRTALDRLEAEGIISPCDPAIIAARIRRGDRRPQGWNLDISLIRGDLSDDDIADLERNFSGLRQRIDAAPSTRPEPVDNPENGVKPVHSVRSGPVDNQVNRVKSVHPVTPHGVKPVPHGVKPVPQRGEASSPEPSFKPSGTLRGTVPRCGPDADAELDGQNQEPSGAKQLIAAYVAGCEHRPPSRVLGQLGREVSTMLAEGIDPAAVSRALERFRERPMHPSALPSLVNDELNQPRPPADTRPATRPVSVAAAVPDADPDDPAAYIAALRGNRYQASAVPQPQQHAERNAR